MRKESDRGSIIVAVSLLDDILNQLLKAKLAPSLDNRDEHFDTATAPFSTFSAKIDLAYRLGLLRAEVRASFHQLRKIRNNFAHALDPKGFDSDSTKSRVSELLKLNKGIIDSMRSMLINSGKMNISEDYNIRDKLDDRLILELVFSGSAAFMLAEINNIDSIEALV
jgi:hypothetical protein